MVTAPTQSSRNLWTVFSGTWWDFGDGLVKGQELDLTVLILQLLYAPFTYWKAAQRFSQSLLFSRLNNPNSLSLSPQKRSCSPIIFMAVLWTRSNMSTALLCCRCQSWMQHSRWGSHGNGEEGQNHLPSSLLLRRSWSLKRPFPTAGPSPGRATAIAAPGGASSGSRRAFPNLPPQHSSSSRTRTGNASSGYPCPSHTPWASSLPRVGCRSRWKHSGKSSRCWRGCRATRGCHPRCCHQPRHRTSALVLAKGSPAPAMDGPAPYRCWKASVLGVSKLQTAQKF